MYNDGKDGRERKERKEAIDGCWFYKTAEQLHSDRGGAMVTGSLKVRFSRTIDGCRKDSQREMASGEGRVENITNGDVRTRGSPNASVAEESSPFHALLHANTVRLRRQAGTFHIEFCLICIVTNCYY